MREPVGRVLVIDDDADIADIVEQVLTDEGYAVTILADPDAEAIHASVVELQPDCVLLDSDAPVLMERHGRMLPGWQPSDRRCR